jgi:hypothetical protein
LTNYTQIAINNINIVLKLIKLILDIWHHEYDIYTTDQLVEFSNNALCKFNSIVPFSNLTWDTTYLESFYSDLAELAACFIVESALEIKISLQKKSVE